jgi:hypothetical protein
MQEAHHISIEALSLKNKIPSVRTKPQIFIRNHSSVKLTQFIIQIL